MKKTCLLYVSTFLGLAACLTAALVALYPPNPGTIPPVPPVALRIPGAGGAALVSALFLTLTFGAVAGVFLKLSERSLVGASLAREPPEDGRRIAASGTLVADGPALTAPFSAAPCVAYYYKIYHSTGGKSADIVTDCWGYALTPSHVETASGGIRILGYTEFDFSATTLEGDESRQRAARYFETTEFVPTGLGAITTAYRALKGVLADEDGSIKTDFGPPPADISHARYVLEEQVVSDREPICAFGTYSAPRRGLVPVPDSRDINPVRIMKGSPEAVRRSLLLGTIGLAVLSVFLAAAAAAPIVAFFYFV